MPHSPNQPSFWQRNLDKIGIGGAAFAALCCLGFPALLAVVSAVGLGFLINDAVLLPLLGVSLSITLWGLYRGTRHHHRWSAFGIGVVGAILMVLSILLGKGFYAGTGIAVLIVASVLNVVLRIRRTSIP
jgi:mercuric ion transport protein